MVSREKLKLASLAAALSAFCLFLLPCVSSWADAEIENKFQILQKGLQIGSSASSGWDQLLTFQVETDLPTDSSGLTFEVDVPSEGFTVQVQDKDSDLSSILTQPLEVAGIPLSEIPGAKLDARGGNPILKGGDGNFFKVSLTKDSYSYIESHGYAPASASSQQASKTGISRGGEFALTFEAMLNAQATAKNTMTSRIFLGRSRSSDQTVTVEKNNGTPPQPVVSQQVLWKGLVDPKIRQNLSEAPYSVSFVRDDFPDSFKPQEKFTIQVETKLPDISLMKGQYSDFIFENYPSVGLSIENSFDVAGIPCKDLPSGCQIKSSQTGDWLQGDGNARSNALVLTSDDISYIEGHGMQPATESSKAKRTKDLSPGDEFAVTFQAFVNSGVSQVYNQALVSYANSDGNTTLPSSAPYLIITVDTSDQRDKYSLEKTQKESKLQILDPNGLVTQNTVYPINEWITMQALVTMPTPTLIRYPHALGIMVEVAKGVSIDYHSDSQDNGVGYESYQPMQIAGISLPGLSNETQYDHSVQIQNIPLTDDDNYPIADSKTFVMAIPGDALEDSIEPSGMSPATATSPQGKVPELGGIEPGKQFAFTFRVELNSDAVENNPVTIKVGDIQYATNNAMTGNWYSTPYSTTVVLHRGASSLGIVNSDGQVVTQFFASPSTSAFAPSKGIANSFKLQLSASLPSSGSSLKFYLSPSEGVTIDGGSDLKDIEVGGVALSALPDPPSVSPSQPFIRGSASSPTLEVGLDPADISYIEAHGVSPATLTQAQGTTPGLKAGEPVALTLWAYLNGESSLSSNALEGYVEWKASSGTALTSEKESLEIFRNTPIQIETHFIAKGGDYQADTVSGWGLDDAGEGSGNTKTLQVSITMPSDAEAKAYQRMVIKIKPEKGVDAMTASPNDSGGNYNTTNWTHVFIAGSDLWYWQNYNLYYNIRPDNGPQWISGESGDSWYISFGPQDLKQIQQSGQKAATKTTAPAWGGVQPGEQFSLKFPVYLNSNSSETGNLVQVTAYWGQSPDNGSGQVSYFNIVKGAGDLPVSSLPLTGGRPLKLIMAVVLSLAFLGASAAALAIYRKKRA
ncbi:MAG: hypothetical protein IKT06_03640 [Aeriscardovia sp.]|nr:hypothetical protein [Aeriscardovia sp.]